MTPRAVRAAFLALAVVLLLGGGLWLGLRPRPKLEPALALLEAQRPDEAEPLIRKYLRAYPSDARANVLLAQITIDRLDRPVPPEPALALDAIEHLKHVSNDDKKAAAQARYLEGEVYDRLLQFDKVEAAWNAAVDLDPTGTEAPWLLIQLYTLQGRTAEARRLALRLSKIDPTPRQRVRALLELVRQDVHRPAAAGIIAKLEPVVRSHPGDLHSALALGRALTREGRSDEGLPILRQAVEAHPDQVVAWDALLTALEDAGQVGPLGDTLMLVPGAIKATGALARHEGWLAQEQSDWKTAAAAYRRALQAEPHDLKLEYRLSRVLRLGGEADEAERVERLARAFETARKELRGLYERHENALRNGPPQPELYQQVADLRERMGRREEARAWHALVLRDHPSDPLSLAAVERLK